MTVNPCQNNCITRLIRQHQSDYKLNWQSVAMQVNKPSSLYNMLQDFRHLVVFDLRPQEEFQESHIRDSFNLYPQRTQQEIDQVLSLASTKADQKEGKYSDLKKVRRYFFIDNQPLGLQSQNPLLQASISRIPKDATNKIYCLNEKYSNFYSNYPFVCFVRADWEKAKVEGSEKQAEMILAYPYCRFPTEIIPNKMFLGNVYSSNSEKQLKDMQIRNLVDFIDYAAIDKQYRSIPQFKKSTTYNYIELPFNSQVQVNINFDEVFANIVQRTGEGRTLLYCRDGETLSAAFVIGLLMYQANLDITMASLKVCQALGRTNVTKWIYTQLLAYKPKK